MYCPKCGGLNADDAAVCTQCGENLMQAKQPNPASPNQVTMPKPESYLIWSILATLFCCLPLGIVSIVFASQVDSRYYMGDVAGATDASNKARTWAVISAVIGAVTIIGYMVLFAAGMASRP
jgi:uncharacterized membrane protein YvbJ